MFDKISDKRKNKLLELFEESPFWTSYGVFYGFPDCCIEGFVKDTNAATKKHYESLPSHGSGYVPCICCAPKVQENWSNFKEHVINKNRISSLAFPNDHNSKEGERFFYKFSSFFYYDPIEMAKLCDVEEIIPTLREEEKLENRKLPVNNKFLKFLNDNPYFKTGQLEDFIFNDQSINKYLEKSLSYAMRVYLKDKDHWDNLEKEAIQDPDTYFGLRTPQMYIKEQLRDKFSVIFRLEEDSVYIDKIDSMIPILILEAYRKIELKFFEAIESKKALKANKNIIK